VNRDANQVAQVLIKWSELPEDLATWEDYEALKQSFPGALQGRENVTADDTLQATATQRHKSPRRSTRPRRANVMLADPKWIS
jgi:hypothetical protein